jgi:hypothetical protein
MEARTSMDGELAVAAANNSTKWLIDTLDVYKLWSGPMRYSTWTLISSTTAAVADANIALASFLEKDQLTVPPAKATAFKMFVRIANAWKARNLGDDVPLILQKSLADCEVGVARVLEKAKGYLTEIVDALKLPPINLETGTFRNFTDWVKKVNVLRDLELDTLQGWPDGVDLKAIAFTGTTLGDADVWELLSAKDYKELSSY